jgi:hypothetical protein
MAFFSGITAAVGQAASRVRSLINELFSPVTNHSILDKDGLINLFADFAILGVDISIDRTVATHPLEINTSLQDNIVQLPKMATVVVAAEKHQISSLYQLLDQLQADPTAMVSILSDGQLYKNMVLKTIPISKDPSKFDLVEIPLVFNEFIFSRAKVSKMDSPENVELAQYSNRQRAGQQRGVLVPGAEAANREAQMTAVPGVN